MITQSEYEYEFSPMQISKYSYLVYFMFWRIRMEWKKYLDWCTLLKKPREIQTDKKSAYIFLNCSYVFSALDKLLQIVNSAKNCKHQRQVKLKTM